MLEARGCFFCDVLARPGVDGSSTRRSLPVSPHVRWLVRFTNRTRAIDWNAPHHAYAASTLHLLSREDCGGSYKSMVPPMARILAHNPVNHGGTRHSITPTVCVPFFGCVWWVSQSLTLLPSCRPSVLSWCAFHSRQQQQHSLLLSMSVILSFSSLGVRHQQP